MSAEARFIGSLVSAGLIKHEPPHTCCDHIYDSYCPCCMNECEAWGDMTNQEQGEGND